MVLVDVDGRVEGGKRRTSLAKPSACGNGLKRSQGQHQRFRNRELHIVTVGGRTRMKFKNGGCGNEDEGMNLRIKTKRYRWQ